MTLLVINQAGVSKQRPALTLFVALARLMRPGQSALCRQLYNAGAFSILGAGFILLYGSRYYLAIDSSECVRRNSLIWVGERRVLTAMIPASV